MCYPGLNHADFRAPSPGQSSEKEASCDAERILRNEANSPVVYSGEHNEEAGTGPGDSCVAGVSPVGPVEVGDIVPGDSTSWDLGCRPHARSHDHETTCDTECILRNEASSPVVQAGEPTERTENDVGPERAEPSFVDHVAMRPCIVEPAEKHKVPPRLIPAWLRWRQARLYRPLPGE